VIPNTWQAYAVSRLFSSVFHESGSDAALLPIALNEKRARFDLHAEEGVEGWGEMHDSAFRSGPYWRY